MLSRPIALGDGFGEAFPGASGAQLRSRLEDLSELSEKKFEAVQTMLYGLNTFNVTAYAFNSEPMSGLSEALDNLPDQSVCDMYSWPTYGSVITFLTATGWVRYRYMMLYEGEGDEGRLDASNWVRIIDSAGGGSSGSGSCQLCEQNAEDITALQTSVSQIKSTANSASRTASTASSKATSAYNLATANEQSISQLRKAIDSLPPSSESSYHQQYDFVDVLSDDSGCMAGAHPSGLTYRYPTTKFNLKAVPTGGQDILILTPVEPALEGTVLRIMDPRMGATGTAPSVKISTYSETQSILGHEREGSDYVIALRGGYVELVAVLAKNAAGTSNAGLQWIVRSVVKFSN